MDDLMAKTEVLYCVTCKTYIAKDEVTEHKGHSIAATTGQIITMRVLERMKGLEQTNESSSSCEFWKG
jgi:hypothetical protein